MLSVSVDVACVRAHAGPLFGGLDDGGAGTTMPHTGEEAAAAPPLLVRVKNPVWTMDSGYPPSPAAVLQRTSSTEQLLRMYNGNSLLQPTLLRQLQWTLNTLHHYTSPGLRYVEEGPVEDWGLLVFLLQSSLIFMLVLIFLQHAKLQIVWIYMQIQRQTEIFKE